MATKKLFGELTLSQINEKHPRLMWVLISSKMGFAHGLNYKQKLDNVLKEHGKDTLRVFYNQSIGRVIHGMSYLIYDTDVKYPKRALKSVYSNFGGEEDLLIAEANARYPKGTDYNSITSNQFMSDSKIAAQPMKNSGNRYESESTDSAYIYTEASISKKMLLIAMRSGHGFVYGKLKNYPNAVEMWAETVEKEVITKPEIKDKLVKSAKCVTETNLRDALDEITKLQNERLELVEKLQSLDSKLKKVAQSVKKQFDDILQGVS